MSVTKKLIKHAKLIFWDFDGVIKESVNVKTEAYVQLFSSFDPSITEKVREHHLINGGMSRYDKIPLYLEWSNEKVNDKIVKQLCKNYSNLVVNKVISSPWVSGVENYLRKNKYFQKFVLISATPQDEIERILDAIKLTRCFSSIYGAPISKKDAIRKDLIKKRIDRNKCLMIGDTLLDYEAAKKNDVSFVLRRHEFNNQILSEQKIDWIQDFI